MKKQKWIALLVLIAMVVMAGCVSSSPSSDGDDVAATEMEVHVIDVGQADAILIKVPNEGNILIDGGTGATEKALVDYIAAQGVTTLDYVIATHPHEDHIGGLDKVMASFDVGMVYMPDVSHTTKAFENMLDVIEEKAIVVKEAKADVALPLSGDLAKGKFLAPVGTDYDSLNDYSAVLKLDYGKTSFLFTGDAEKISEQEMLDKYSAKTLAASVLKVGHHGSKTSTSEAFLQAVNPTCAVISVGKDNDYGLPNEGTLALLAQKDIPYWRTDEVGSVLLYSDGQQVRYGEEDLTQKVEDATEQPIVSEVTKASVTIETVDRVGEVVTLYNSGSAEIDLSGWVLVSVQGDQRLTLPEGTVLAGGGRLEVLSGENATAGVEQVVWSTQNIWNNKQDPAELYDAQGNKMAQQD